MTRAVSSPPAGWQLGRQGTGYEKRLLARGRWPLPFDVWLLRYRPGAGVPTHTDPVPGKRHYRLNVLLRRAEGGVFHCERTLWRRGRVVLFRPDQSLHRVTPVTHGTRYVLSVGWVLSAG
ncbi:2OG-Fe(II) oxygenase [Parvularcula dongshanensis]|uniref:Fe2OG dioxygenase domain-containing protein n=1 Tax=Parvularcula dongshanensis TaxID=1173995 RepID=A0A840I676_9PROT|nr:2OG-Fe(II) oxygenase [Parvularcula dongshanensis]MBB4660337.1 hypothetical protein [Parvularcula dongshanensis]